MNALMQGKWTMLITRGILAIIAVLAAYAIVVGMILIIRGVEEKMGGPDPGPIAYA